MLSSRSFGWALIVGAGSVLLGCSSSSSDAGQAAHGPSAGGAGAGPLDNGATAITFSSPELVLLPGQTTRVPLVVLPPGVYPVALALVGDARDAYLDASEITTDDQGKGTFSLTAPTSPTGFSVRASTGVVAAELSVSQGDSSTTLEVVPSYGGHRVVSQWTATVSTGRSCDTTVVPPPDGASVATAASHPRVSGVPLGTPITVTVRAGHFAGGCVDLPRVVADPSGSVPKVTVPVFDRPLTTEAASLPVRLGIDTGMAWVDAFRTVNQNMQVAFSPSKVSDASSLLDALHDVTPDTSQGAFTLERSLRLWDDKLARALDGDLGQRGMRAAVGHWIDGVLPTLSDRAVTGILASSKGATPSLSVDRVGGIAPADAAFPVAFETVSFSASSDDKIVFGGTVPSFSVARLAASLALGPAQADFPAATTVADALTALVKCDVVASTLAGSSGVAYAGCTTSCIERRCGEALTAMWGQAAAVASAAVLDVSASATVTRVTDDAAPERVDGTWVGTLHLGSADVHVGGVADSGDASVSIP